MTHRPLLRSGLFLVPLLLLCQIFCAGTLAAKDYGLIQQLPTKIAKVRIETRKGQTSGVTATMKNATYDYNNAMVAMIKDLLGAYFPKDYLSDESIDNYLKALYTMRHFRHDATDPNGENGGTMGGLEVTADVSGDLEEMVTDMVQAIVKGDAKFNFKAWKRKWDSAGR